MSNQKLKRVIPAIFRQSEVLNTLLPPKPKKSSFGTSMDIYVGGFFGFKHEELCSAHAASYLQLSKQFEIFDVQIEKFNETANSIRKDLGDNPSPEDMEGFNYTYYKQLELFTSREHFLNSVQSFTDQHFVIGLWVLVEQHIAKLLNIYKEKIEADFKIPYSWNDTIPLLNSLGVNTDESLPIYQNINELRVLNNKLKHLNMVDNKLSEFPYFQDKKGKDLDKISLDLQRYSDNAFAFIYFIGEQLVVEDKLV